MQDHLRHMLLFRTLVDAGTLTAAAEQLSLSKSVLSQHLKALEQALGVQLLQRTTRKQVLTPAGQEFYQRCADIEHLVDVAWQTARDSQQGLSGPIRITAPYALMDSVVAPAIARLVAEHPDIEPDLIAEDKQLNLIEQRIDLAIRVGESPDSHLRQRRIGHFRETLVASEGYLQQAPALNPDNTDQQHFIRNAWQGHNSTVTLWRQNISQRFTFKASRHANNLNAVLALARSGAGLAYVPQFLLLGEPLLQQVLPGCYSPEVNVYAIHPYQPLPRLVQQAIQEVESTLQELCGGDV